MTKGQLVATETANDRHGIELGLQPGRHRMQDLVTNRVAVSVVDGLELVEINEAEHLAVAQRVPGGGFPRRAGEEPGDGVPASLVQLACRFRVGWGDTGLKCAKVPVLQGKLVVVADAIRSTSRKAPRE